MVDYRMPADVTFRSELDNEKHGLKPLPSVSTFTVNVKSFTPAADR
jgi:hypothetical protein